VDWRRPSWAFRALWLMLALYGAVRGQSFVEPGEIAAAAKAFDPSESAPQLRCSFNAIHPALNFGFRFQTGYMVDIPLNQYHGPGHDLKILVRVTPDGREPRYLTSTAPLPDLHETKVNAEVPGTLVVGEGSYAVEAVVRDDQDRVCRGNWRIQAKLSGSERDLKPATPPGTVAELSPDRPKAVESKAGPKIERLTVMLHAAPFAPRAAKVQDQDIRELVNSLSSVLDQLPARSVRLVVFTIDRQKVLLRKDGFQSNDLGDVRAALNQLQLAVVDYRTLQDHANPIDFLTGLVRTELRDPQPSDGVILLGPRASLLEDVPAKSLDAYAADVPLFYLQYRPRQVVFRRQGADPGEGAPRRRGVLGPPPGPVWNPSNPSGAADAIEQLVKRLKGETIAIQTPHDLADAIRRMAPRIRTTAAPAESVLPALRPPPTNPDQMRPVGGTAADGSPPAVSTRRVAAPGHGAPPPDKIPASEPPAGDEDPVAVLMRLRDQVLEHATRIPNHTCVETVQRDRYEPTTGRSPKSCDALVARRKQSDFPLLLRLDSTDRLRLDVALASSREIYSWAGASKFEEGDIDELIPEGAIGTGPFAAMLLGIFGGRPPEFVFEGDTMLHAGLDGGLDAGLDVRRMMEYSFSVPQEESHYRVKAGKEWVITGYTGSLLVDPKTSELVRLTVRTEELPPETGTCETKTTLEYGMVPLDGVDYFLPKTTHQRFIGRDGSEGENAVTFAACREYRGESTLTFGDKLPAPGIAGGSAPLPDGLPAGLPFTVELTTAIQADRSAAGDRIEGRLAKPIRDARGQKTLVPAGALLEGRLMRVETRHVHPELVVALRWETIDWNGSKIPFTPAPDRHIADLRSGGRDGLRQRGMAIELPLPSESRYGVYHFPGGSVAVPAGFRSEWVTAQP